MNLYGSGNDPKAEKPAKKKITVPEIRAIKGTDRRISMVTCYDYTFAKLVDKSDIEMILVGDSLNMLMLGHSGTVGATVDDMIYHIKPVVARPTPSWWATCPSARTTATSTGPWTTPPASSPRAAATA